MEGDKGVINLLRRFHDHHLEPVSNRLPVYEIAIGDDLITNLKYAFEAQNQASELPFEDFIQYSFRFLLIFTVSIPFRIHFHYYAPSSQSFNNLMLICSQLVDSTANPIS